MNKKIEAYVDSLFEGLKPSDSLNETKEELVINLNEKYQDLLSEGLNPEQAYKKVIASIGDVEELIQAEASAPKFEQKVEVNIIHQKRNSSVLRAFAVALFILCPVPLIVLDNISDKLSIYGLVGLLSMVAVGVMLMMLSRGQQESEVEHEAKKRKDTTDGVESISVFTKKDRRLLSNINGLIYILAALLFFSSFLGHFYFNFVIFIIAFAITKIIELIYYYFRLEALQKANKTLSKTAINKDVYKLTSSVIWTIAVAFFLSGIFRGGLSWLVFIVAAAVVQLTKTIIDVEEDDDEEN